MLGDDRVGDQVSLREQLRPLLAFFVLMTETFALATLVASEVQTRRADRVAIYPLHWKLGYHRTDASILAVPEAFGHFGLGGAGGWANPELKLSFAFLHGASPVTIVGQTRTAMMTGAVYESLGIYKGICHTLRNGPVVDLVPKRV